MHLTMTHSSFPPPRGYSFPLLHFHWHYWFGPHDNLRLPRFGWGMWIYGHLGNAETLAFGINNARHVVPIRDVGLSVVLHGRGHLDE